MKKRRNRTVELASVKGDLRKIVGGNDPNADEDPSDGGGDGGITILPSDDG